VVGWKSVGQVRTRSILSRRAVRESERGLVSITEGGTGPGGVVGSCRLFVAFLIIVGSLSRNDAAMLSITLVLVVGCVVDVDGKMPKLARREIDGCVAPGA